MSIIIGIVCLFASLFYGITAAEQETLLNTSVRIIASLLYMLAACIWLFP